VVAADAFEAIRRSRQGQASHEALRAARGVGQSRGISHQRHGGVYQRECVVIDGAQWLRGAGEFNDLLLLRKRLEAMETARHKNPEAAY